jgi:hypothetical protein
MNSLSYACPELLAGEDGLSDAARAEEVLLERKSESGFISVGSRTSLKADAVYISHRCELSVAETMYEDRIRPEDDQLCRGGLCEVHRRRCRQSWMCGKCSARLRDGRNCIQWEDGYCGRCGVLNRRKPDMWTLKAGPLVVVDDGKARETWPPLDGWRARVSAAITSLGTALTGTVRRAHRIVE